MIAWRHGGFYFLLTAACQAGPLRRLRRDAEPQLPRDLLSARTCWRFYGPTQVAQAPGSPVGADLGRDLARSGSNPVNAFFQEEMRRPVYDGYAADRDQGQLPQDSPRTFGAVVRHSGAKLRTRTRNVRPLSPHPAPGSWANPPATSSSCTSGAGFSGLAMNMITAAAPRSSTDKAANNGA